MAVLLEDACGYRPQDPRNLALPHTRRVSTPLFVSVAQIHPAEYPNVAASIEFSLVIRNNQQVWWRGRGSDMLSLTQGEAQAPCLPYRSSSP